MLDLFAYFLGRCQKVKRNSSVPFHFNSKTKLPENNFYPPKIPLSPYVHVQSEAKLKLGHRKEAVGSPKRSSLMSETHELNISDEFSLVLSFAEKERIT